MNSEPLANLERIGLLDPVPFSAALMLKMLNVAPTTVRILDSLRKQRNLTDYDGALVTDSLLRECIEQAGALLALANQTLSDQ
jgi:hypothetical protein